MSDLSPSQIRAHFEAVIVNGYRDFPLAHLHIIILPAEPPAVAAVQVSLGAGQRDVDARGEIQAHHGAEIGAAAQEDAGGAAVKDAFRGIKFGFGALFLQSSWARARGADVVVSSCV